MQNLEDFIQQGLEIMGNGDAQDVVSHFRNGEIAEEFGFGLVVAGPSDLPTSYRVDPRMLLRTCDRLSGFYRRYIYSREQTNGDYYHVDQPTVTVFDVIGLGELSDEVLDPRVLEKHNMFNYFKAWAEGLHYQMYVRGRGSLEHMFNFGINPGVFVRNLLVEQGVMLESTWQENHRYYLSGNRG